MTVTVTGLDHRSSIDHTAVNLLLRVDTNYWWNDQACWLATQLVHLARGIADQSIPNLAK